MKRFIKSFGDSQLKLDYLSLRLLEAGCKVIDIDNLNDYNDVILKEARLERLGENK